VPAEEPLPDAEDELVPPKPFIFETDPVTQEEAAAQDPTYLVHISLAPIPEDSQPSTPASKPEQPIVQDPPTTSVLDLNEHAEDQQRDDQEF